jgi:competence protein ComEA
MSQPPNVPRPLAGGSEFADRLRALRSDARVGAALLACVAIAAGVAWFRAGIAPSQPVSGGDASSAVDPSAVTTTTAAVTTSTAATEIVVDVVGAVRVPSVVTLPADSRVVDAIRAAGGAAAGADLVRLNLAAKLADGARVAVPLLGQPPPAVDPSAVTGSVDPSAGTNGADGSTDGGPINVNTASAEALEELPGIGPTLAAAIVEDREQNGPFTSVDDLNRVSGIGEGRLAPIRDLVTV